MHIWNCSTQRFFTFFFLLFSCVLFAQQPYAVQFSGTKMRAPLVLPKGNATIQICGLEPGNTYKVIAVPMAYAQRADFELAPASVLSTGASHFAFMRAHNNAVSFAAPEGCVDLQINSKSPESGDEVPMFLSIKCESCPEVNDWLKGISGLADQSVLQVQDGFSAQELVQDVLVGGGCFQISNVTYQGEPSQIGKFSNGLSNIGFSDGLILATGNIRVALGPNLSNSAGWGFGYSTPDSDLSGLSTGSINDMADIEFDFVPTQSQVSFEFVFASEEYCEFVNTKYNDVFGFFISGPGIVGNQNLAVIPTTTTPVSINTVNHMVNSFLYQHNTPSSGNNCANGGSGIPPPAPVPPASGPAVNELQYDGFTKKMVALANVIPCQKYHIKLKIADVADGVWDSAVFLRANSFSAGGEVLASPAYPGAQGAAYENCSTGNMRFKRGNNADLNQPLVIHFSVAGSATPGVDYTPINSPVIIPAGQTELLVPVNVIPDLIPEGPETIQLTIPNTCSCSQSPVDFVINDRPTITLQAAGNQLLCIGDTAELAATVSGGLPGLSYQWSTGETTESIHPTSSGTYSLTVSDGCSPAASAVLELGFVNCTCSAETFIKTLGTAGQRVRGYGVYDSKDGNLYLTGSKQDSAVIIKITTAGDVLWTRSFEVQDGATEHISELIVDSDGRLVGCGQSGETQPGLSGFVFRYNPLNNTMQWINTYGLESPYVMGLVELPNGNYLIYDNPHNATNDNRMLEITRADGTIDSASPLSQKLNLGGGDNFNSALIHNGKLYGVGRYTNGSDFVNMRHALSRINLANGNVEWSRLSHVSPDNAARLYGMDLLIEDEHIISVSYGSEVDDNLNNSQLFLQKTDLDGNLIWVQRLDLLEITGEIVDELISVPDGFILYAHGNQAPSDLYLIKTDKAGVFQGAVKVDYGFQDYIGAISTYQSQILLKDNHLFFMASTEGATESQMLLVKTTLNGLLEGDCDFIKPTPVASGEVSNPSNFSVLLEQVPYQETIGILVRNAQNTVLTVENQCKVFVNDVVKFELCFGETVEIEGQLYGQDTTFSVEVSGQGECDTLRTYTVNILPQPMRSAAVTLCPGDFVLIGGQTITQGGIYLLQVAGANGDCDTLITYTVTSLPYPTRQESISFCAGSSVTIGGQVYNQSGTVIDTLPSALGCDTIVTYTLTVLPIQTRNENISFCFGGTVTIGGQVYTQSGIVVDTLSSGLGCDTIVTYTLTVLPIQTRNESISFCPGESVTIGGQVYTQTGTVNDTLQGLNGACDTLVTYTLTLLPQPRKSETIAFCPGETINLGGNNYTQPGTVVLNLPSITGGCDTIATYTLQFSTPATSTVKITCPPSISLDPLGTSGGATFNFLPATATSDCTCPGISIQQTSGLASGSNFPTGVNTVCFAAKDSCGNTASCCFNVSVEEEEGCDVKVNGCVKYELLTITEDMGKNRTYRIRVTNNCSNKLIYTAVQIPNGLVATAPLNLATYTAPSGNTYVVRSPNYAPQYSLRFSSVSDSIQNGESDIFKYTLPAQAQVTFINVVSRLAPSVFVSAHLNTFYCPIGVTPTDDRPGGEREDLTTFEKLSNLDSAIALFPNPTSGELFADLSFWAGQQLRVQVLDGQGKRVQQSTILAIGEAQAIELPSNLPGGIYFLEVVTEGGEKRSGRFVMVR